MANYIFRKTGRLSDRQIWEFFDDLKNNADNVTEGPVYSAAGIVVNHSDAGLFLEESETFAITNARVLIYSGSFNVHYYRGETLASHDGNYKIYDRQNSPYFDEFIVELFHNNPSGARPSLDIAKYIDRIISKHAHFSVPSQVNDGAHEAFSLLNSEMAALSALHRKMVRDSIEQRKQLEDSIREKRNEIELEIALNREELNKKRKDDEEHISVLRDEIERSKKALYDRNHMHVRRDLREKITQQIERRVSGALLPASSWILNVLIVCLISACSLLAGYFSFLNFDSLRSIIDYPKAQLATAFPNADILIWIFLARGSISAVVCLGFAAYLLNWLRKTYLDNVKATSDLQKYALDINRASWAIETIMEITEKEGNSLPDKWIEGACYGLFQQKADERVDSSALDALGAILGISARAEFGPNGPKIELEKGQLKKLGPVDECAHP